MRVLLLSAGLKTTAGLISHTVCFLAQHPEQWAAVSKDGSLIPAAIEETLRYDGPAQWLARHTTQEVTLPEGAIPSGQGCDVIFVARVACVDVLVPAGLAG